VTRGRSLAPLGITGLLAAFLSTVAVAQSVVAGRVARIQGTDTLPVGGLSVVLHRVARLTQGPVDTARTDPAGRFRFRFTADTTAAYLLSARYAGIEHFSQPVGIDRVHPDTAVVVIVSDTSSSAPVAVRQRTLLISRADEGGTRTVIDWFVLANRGDLTRVAPDTIHPSWATPLPEDAQNVEVADTRLSQFSPDAVVFRRDSALIFAPLSPGEKELMLQYRIPGALRRFVAPSGGGVDSVFVLVEEPSARVLAPRMIRADSQLIQGRAFRRWAGVLPAGSAIEVGLPAPLLSQGRTLAVLVGVAALAFFALAWYVLRRRRFPAGSPLPVPPSVLADAIAHLDVRYLGREGDVPPEEWRGYLEERLRMKEALAAALAAAHPGS
jgi:hypothetical protein